MMATVKLEHNTPQWLEFRYGGIGGSDASAILGMNPYKTNVVLWEEKALHKPSKPLSCVEAVEYGKSAEKPLRELFSLDFPQHKVIEPKNEVFVHENGFMFASLDGMLIERESGKLGILEIKTSNIFASMHAEKWKDKIPQNYYIQLLHYMAVTNAEFAILSAQLRGSDDNGMPIFRRKHYRFELADVKEDIKYLVQKEQDFWGSVKAKKRPSLILPEL